MDADLAIIHARWANLTELDRGTASWVVEVLSERRQGVVHLANELKLQDVLDLLAGEADNRWHCDCCARSRD